MRTRLSSNLSSHLARPVHPVHPFRLQRPSLLRGLSTSALAVSALVVQATACGDIPVENEIAPAGNILGTVVYAGPMPCTKGGHVVGAAEILVFSEMLLPPPEGLGTSAASLAVVSGDKLFAGIYSSLPSNDDPDVVACPPAGTPPVTVTSTYAVGPLRAGAYQVRGFYDYDGGFSPILGTQSLPTAGDIGGGSLVNAVEAAGGAKPIYNRILLGNEGKDGTFTMPDTGARVDNVTVTLGKELTWGRPIYHWTQAFDGSTELTDPNDWVLKQDRRFSLPPKQNAAVAASLFFRVKLGAGLLASETATAEKSPFDLQAGPPYNKFILYPGRDDTQAPLPIPEIVTTPFTANVNGMDVAVPKDGVVVADLFPQAIFARLSPSDPTNLTPLAAPAGLIQGILVHDSLVQTTAGAVEAAIAKSDEPGVLVQDDVEIYVRPSIFCLNPLDPDTHIFAVTPSLLATNDDETDPLKRAVIFPEDLRPKLAERFKQYMHGTTEENLARIHIVEGCLPKGSFALSMVYDTLQSWTAPNEAGVCKLPLEIAGVDTSGSPICTQAPQAPRPRLLSQKAFLKVGGYTGDDESYCKNVHATNRGDKSWTTTDATGQPVTKKIQFMDGVPTVCLSADEIVQSEVVE